jgi:hypothetical protein
MKLGMQILAKAWICIVLHLRGFVWLERWCSGKQAYSWVWVSERLRIHCIHNGLSSLSVNVWLIGCKPQPIAMLEDGILANDPAASSCHVQCIERFLRLCVHRNSYFLKCTCRVPQGYSLRSTHCGHNMKFSKNLLGQSCC